MRIPLLLIALLLAGCASEEQICLEKIEKLDVMRREAAANLHRQQAECQAVAIEFKGDRMLVDNCMDTFRKMADITRDTVSMIDKRMGEEDIQRCKAKFPGI